MNEPKTGPLGVVPNPVKQAAHKLAEELKRRPGLVVKTGAAITFEALEVHGTDGSVFVSVHQPEDGEVAYLWACPHPALEDGGERCEYYDLCEPIGGPGMVTAVAAQIHRRVGVMS